jgi:hypothetical protein
VLPRHTVLGVAERHRRDGFPNAKALKVCCETTPEAVPAFPLDPRCNATGCRRLKPCRLPAPLAKIGPDDGFPLAFRCRSSRTSSCGMSGPAALEREFFGPPIRLATQIAGPESSQVSSMESKAARTRATMPITADAATGRARDGCGGSACAANS